MLTRIDWLDLLSQAALVIIGGLLVLVTNAIAERRRRIAETEAAAEKLRQHERAIFTAIFSIRNFLAEHLGSEGDEGLSQPDFRALASAQQHLHRLIEKSQPDSQILLMIVFEISLRLDDLLNVAARTFADEATPTERLLKKQDALVEAIGQFDLVASSSLEFLTDEDVEALIRNSEAR